MKSTLIKVYSENNQFQAIETLRRNRIKRHKSREFFVEGVRAITQAVENHWLINALVYSREQRLSDWASRIIATSGAKKLIELPLPLLRKLSQKEDSSELLAVVAMPDDDLMRIPIKRDNLVVVLDRLASPGNIGTIMRSVDAMQANGLILSGHSADLYDPETIQATTGSFFSVPTVRVSSPQDLISWIEQQKNGPGGLQVVGTSAKVSIPVYEHDFRGSILLLVGNETHGLSDAYKALADVMVTIPMHGYASSLNVACATSILLYEITRQRQTALQHLSG